MRRMWIAAIALVAIHVRAGEITDAMRTSIEPRLPARLQELECPETAEETKALFWCSGALVDGQWIHVQANRKPDGRIDVIDLVYYPAPEESLRKVARAGATADIRTMQCPSDAGVKDWNFECEATLVDGSRFRIVAQRQPAGRIATDPFLWDPASPSPMIAAVRAAAASVSNDRIVSIACPNDLSGVFDCEVRYAAAQPISFRLRRDSTGYRILGTSAEHHRSLRIAGTAALAGGLAMVIAGIAGLIALNVRSFVTRVPFAAEQTVTIPAAGAYVLYQELPYFTWIPWRSLSYTMREHATGREVPLQRDVFPATISWDKVRRSIRLFRVSNQGRYVLRVTGLMPNRDVSQWSLVIARSFIGRGLACVLLVIAGVLLAMTGVFLQM